MQAALDYLVDASKWKFAYELEEEREGVGWHGQLIVIPKLLHGLYPFKDRCAELLHPLLLRGH